MQAMTLDGQRAPVQTGPGEVSPRYHGGAGVNLMNLLLWRTKENETYGDTSRPCDISSGTLRKYDASVFSVRLSCHFWLLGRTFVRGGAIIDLPSLDAHEPQQ